MKKIVILSDTHGYWHPEYDSHIIWSDEVWHAGDVGSISVIESIRKANPDTTLRVVYGNIDGSPISNDFPETQIFTVSGVKVILKHIVGRPEKYTKVFVELIKKELPNLIVCGHSHILLIAPVPKLKGCIHVNPGALGLEGFHIQKTLIRMILDQGAIKDIQVVDFGKRTLG